MGSGLDWTSREPTAAAEDGEPFVFELQPWRMARLISELPRAKHAREIPRYCLVAATLKNEDIGAKGREDCKMHIGCEGAYKVQMASFLMPFYILMLVTHAHL